MSLGTGSRHDAPQENPCPRCRGTGFVTEVRDGVSYARRCDCRRRLRLEHRMTGARIPRRYDHCDLDHFQTLNNPSLEKALQLARRVVDFYPTQREEQIGLLLTGPCGVGKTHLAVAVLKRLIRDYGVNGLFAEFNDLLRRIQESFDPRSQTPSWEVLHPALEADVLVLDDLGATRTTPWVRDTVGLIVNERYNAQRLTILTTNRPDDDTGGREESLADRVGERLVSRLAEMCWSVRMDGQDFRRRVKLADYRG